MKIYFAGTPGNLTREREWRKLLNRRLFSFWDISQDQFAVKEAFIEVQVCGSGLQEFQEGGVPAIV